MNPETIVDFSQANGEGKDKEQQDKEVEEFFQQNKDFLTSYAQDSSFSI